VQQEIRVSVARWLQISRESEHGNKPGGASLGVHQHLSPRSTGPFYGGSRMSSIEERLAAVESEIAQIKARRARLIPPELDGNPNVQMVMKDCLRHYFEKMRDFAGQRTLDERTTEMNRLRAEAECRLQQKQKEELAEICAAIDYFERTGQSPPGYDISE
jgi:hypothetical protein